MSREELLKISNLAQKLAEIKRIKAEIDINDFEAHFGSKLTSEVIIIAEEKHDQYLERFIDLTSNIIKPYTTHQP